MDFSFEEAFVLFASLNKQRLLNDSLGGSADAQASMRATIESAEAKLRQEYPLAYVMSRS